MKYLLPFILLAGLCKAQEDYGNFTRVTAYRLVNQYESREKPCSIKEYVKREQRVGYYIQAEQSTDAGMAYGLLRLKNEALLNWPAQKHECSNNWSGNETIRNMYIIEINKHRDTLYTTTDNCAFFIPEGKVFFDNESAITGTLNDTFKDFFSRDFTKEIKEHKPDSISVEKVTINGLSPYNLNRKSFEKKIGKFQLARTDSVFNRTTEVYKEYWLNNLQTKFNEPSGKIHELNYRYATGDFQDTFTLRLGGLQAGDSIGKVIKLFPASAKFRNWGAHTSAPQASSYYEVQFTGEKGFAFIYIRDEVIREIEITFF
ncbi:hypothetical protein [Flavobacterium sp. MK4S-17]|uniref:hypothetical protein n=1 Tax=Flavobacterium sp. MK4S-17 TaxID=2543737 RepID=UPI0013592F60|nr:hypothetical protein [Flavobacterium sp. MK4S-17]